VSALAVRASNDDACAESSRMQVAAEAGRTYHVAVDGYEGASGSFTLRWGAVPPPPNDAFAAAQELSGPSGSASGTTLGATNEPGEPTHVPDAGGASIWFSWTAPASRTAVFSTCGSSFDTVLAVYSGTSLGSLAAVTRNDDVLTCGDRTSDRSTVRFAAVAGTTYRLAVDGYEGAVGAVALSWATYAPPPNDAFARPRGIGGARGRVTGSTLGATGEAGEPLHGGRGGASVWFRWRAPASMRVVFSTCDAPYDTLLGLYRGARLASLRRLDTDDDGCGRGVGSSVVANVARGVVYRVAVDGLTGAAGRYALSWRAAPCIVPGVVGLTLARAQAAIRAAGCSVGNVRTVASALVPRGRVVAQAPAPGRRLGPRARVHLEVSGGRG
jgi:hypothetical protein